MTRGRSEGPPRAHRGPRLPLLGLDSPAGPADAERGGCCPLLLPEEAELPGPLFLSMSEAVAAALGELCGINGGLGGGGGRSGAGAAGTQAHGVRGRRGSAAAAVLGLHGDIFPCFLTRLLKLGGEAAGGAVEPGGGSERGGGGGRGSEVRAGPGGAEAAGQGARSARRPRRPAGDALPPRGRGEGWLSWCRGRVSPTRRPTLAAGPRPSCSWNGDESPNSISKNPDGVYI